MKLTHQRFFASGIFLSVALLVAGMFVQRAVADSISFNPASGNGLTPFTVTVEGFIGSNGPVPVSVSGEVFGSCSGTRPCVIQGSMPHFSGKHWVTASALVDGAAVIISNSFTVFDAEGGLDTTCGPNGTKVLVYGNHFDRNAYPINVEGTSAQADSDGAFAKEITINAANGPYDIIASDGFHSVTNRFEVGPTLCEKQIGRVFDLTGGATLQRPGGQPQKLKPGDPIRLGDEIKTAAGGKVRIGFLDNSDLILSEKGKFTIDAYVYDPVNHQNDGSVLNAIQGAFKYVSGLIGKHDDNVSIKNPYGNIGIRGTEFINRRDPCSTTQEVYLIHGQLAIKPTYASVTNIVDAPATILFDATNVWTSGLTQAAYDAMKDQVNQTNPVTLASWLEQYFGCTNGNPSATATADPDGDGQNNYSEFLTHTDPTTNASVFRLLSAAREGDGVRLVWQTHGGITNVVQAAASLDGSYSNIGPDLVIPGDADVTTNYLDAGVIANAAARFYRVRLVQ